MVSIQKLTTTMTNVNSVFLKKSKDGFKATEIGLTFKEVNPKNISSIRRNHAKTHDWNHNSQKAVLFTNFQSKTETFVCLRFSAFVVNFGVIRFKSGLWR